MRSLLSQNDALMKRFIFILLLIIASIQAAEAIKIIAGTGTPLFDSLLMLDSRTMSFSKIEF